MRVLDVIRFHSPCMKRRQKRHCFLRIKLDASRPAVVRIKGTVRRQSCFIDSNDILGGFAVVLSNG